MVSIKWIIITIFSIGLISFDVRAYKIYSLKSKELLNLKSLSEAQGLKLDEQNVKIKNLQGAFDQQQSSLLKDRQLILGRQERFEALFAKTLEMIKEEQRKLEFFAFKLKALEDNNRQLQNDVVDLKHNDQHLDSKLEFTLQNIEKFQNDFAAQINEIESSLKEIKYDRIEAGVSNHPKDPIKEALGY